MRERVILILAVALCCLVPLSAAFATDTAIRIDYYAQTGCDECRKVNALILPRLEDQYSGQYELHRYDIAIPEHYLKLSAALEHLEISDNSPACMIIGERVYLGGYRTIEDSLFETLERLRAHPATPTAQAETDGGTLRRRGEGFTIGAVLAAGLVDGINPCVFATLVFFISLLTLSHARRHTLFWVGIAYCTACFISYFALGFGLFRFLHLLNGFQEVRSALEWALIVLLLLFAFLSFRDAWRFRNSGKAKDIVLQLPDSLKRRIHDVMKRGLSYRFLIPGAFLTGILVTLMESVCTGQVYVPTLALLSREFGVGSRWFFYLLLYNIMFIVPLLVIFVAAWRGTGVPALIRWSKAHVVWSKMVLGSFFLGLSLLMFFLNVEGNPV